MKNEIELIKRIARAKIERKPYKINFASTYRCNSRCKTCGIWEIYKRNPEKEKEELQLDEIEKIFSSTNSFCWASLTGGEPFLRNDLEEIAAIISETNRISLLSMPTNGYLTSIDKRVKRLLEETEIPMISVSVSLDGEEQLHDTIRGIEGSWRKARETYTQLKSIGDERLQVYVEYTASVFNEGHLKETMESFGISDFYSDVILTVSHSSFFYNKKDICCGKKILDEIIPFQKVLQLKSAKEIIPFLYSLYLKKYLTGEPITLSCVSGTSSLFVDPYGNVYPCLSLDKPMGNLRDSEYDLESLTRSERAASVRDTVKKGRCPGCWTPCEAYQMIVENLPKTVIGLPF